MKNMQQMMRQVKKMQEEMQRTQEALKEKVVEGSAGGGAVVVKANGHKQILDIAIKPEVIDPEDAEMLQDLVLTAVNDALRSVDELVAKEMGRFTGGMNIPGLF
ncbi:YbaB/EbfC family nucleoid-associated protein [Brevibacillus sp. SYP-B805]|uniref:YbaB/EbfC family nucleoid-associated protein n=1 Tax=Brevibacillus sp. SYP-B805 TaxID=1578199 RepID=UPI0013EBA851|nr:YbaB/EbfC family nucleoid-associated protein [Brevibacillus sp. SYP-B805]NGQ96515.1 YbaB/EbfC family nucleoid-associated protein [Brevibacillus sp. SYP-B805]